MEGINDIFIQNTSGIPYVARCYGGNYCKTQPDHELVTGFFAAINSFKGELGQSELNNVIYDQINLLFESEGELLVVCNIDNDVDEENFRQIASNLQNKFIDLYGDPTSTTISANQDFSKFTEWMDSQVGNGMADLRPLLEPKQGIWSRIKSWFI